MPDRICLFGGTFDPIHIGHLRIANEALKRFSIARVLFVPAAHPPHKDEALLTPYEDRYHMVELACTPYPSFSASSLESRAGPSYTVDTLERVRNELPGGEIFFLIGADAFAEVATWKRWREVIASTQFIVVSRPGQTYAVPGAARVLPLEGIDIPISSTAIRDRLRAGETVAEIPVEVREYIQDRGLYRAQAAASEP